MSKEKPFTYQHSARPKEKPAKPLPFTGQSNYRENYHNNQILDQNTPIKAKDNIIIDKKTPFNSKSLYNQEYVPYPLEKAGAYYNRNKESHIITPDRVGVPSSHYRTCYSGYKPEFYVKINCPMKYLPTPPRYLAPGKEHIVYLDELNKWN